MKERERLKENNVKAGGKGEVPKNNKPKIKFKPQKKMNL